MVRIIEFESIGISIQVYGRNVIYDTERLCMRYAEKSRDFLRKFIGDGKTKFSDEIFKEIAEFEKRVDVEEITVREKLSAIKEKGDRLFEILNIT